MRIVIASLAGWGVLNLFDGSVIGWIVMAVVTLIIVTAGK